MAGSRRARLADRHASALLGALRTPAARVLPAPDGFRVAQADAAAPCAVVIDPARPETPGDHVGRLQRVIDDCAADATIALVACGGAPTAGAFRAWAPVQAQLASAGFAVTLTPFDLLGACSPWRAALGARRDRVLAALDDHLAAPSVRRALGLVETHLVAALAPGQTARVLVVGRRGITTPGVAPSRSAFDAAMRPLLHDDAVMRSLAFVDAELLGSSGVDVLGWMASIASDAVAPVLRSRGRWWHHDLERQRFGEAAAYGLAQAAIDALDGDLAATLEYELVSAFNAAIGRWLDEECPA